jgi:hypothetical protein
MKRQYIALIVTGLLILASGGASWAQNSNPGIIPVNQQYVKLSAQWWQWAYSFPVSNNPLFDETGAQACLGKQEPGNIFFLAGVFNVSGTATRNITVPSGTRLFFPVLNVEWDNVGFPPMTVEELYQMAAGQVDATTELHASIDGQPVQNLFSYRVQSDPFCYTLPATDNIAQFFGLGADLPPFACASGFCICPAVSDGFWLLTTPLPLGQHTINFGGTVGPPVNFTLDITYNITVVPRGQYQGCQ